MIGDGGFERVLVKNVLKVESNSEYVMVQGITPYVS
jgi:ribosomal protein L3